MHPAATRASEQLGSRCSAGWRGTIARMRRPLTVRVDGRLVVAMLHLPSHDPPATGWPVVIECHGVNGSKIGPNRAFVAVAEHLEETGIATVRADYRGAGDSEGDPEDLTPATARADVLAVLAEIRDLDAGRVGLIGHSFGGIVAAGLSRELPGVQGVALWSTPTDPPTLEPGEHPTEGGLDWDGTPLGRGFVEGMAASRPVADLIAAGVPVLLVHGAADTTVPPSQSRRAAVQLGAAGIPVHLDIVPGADHSFGTGRKRLVELTADWIARHLLG